jgi:hypothetical protein
MINLIEDLSKISWNVTEAEYRADKAISYSTLSTFQNEGVSGLKSILEGKKLETEAILFGSLVDCILTAPEDFDKRYKIVNTSVTEIEKVILDEIYKKIYNKYYKKAGKKNSRGADRPSLVTLVMDHPQEVEEIVQRMGYGNSNYKLKTRVDKLVENGYDYFQYMDEINEGKTLVNQYDYNDAIKMVDKVKSHPYTKWIFEEKEGIRVYYQQKFKINFRSSWIKNADWYEFRTNNFMEWKESLDEKHTIKCMFDILYVNHAEKFIVPVDFKTTGKSENEFLKSFNKYNYDIQATMYSYILKKYLRSNEYFYNFEVRPFMFLPVNKFSLLPQLYESVNSRKDCQSAFMDHENKLHKPWYELLDEVKWHINNNVLDYRMETVINNGINYI